MWPFLLRIEFLGLLVSFTFLMLWSLAFNAPLEEPANPAFTPNPSKAPWRISLACRSCWSTSILIAGVVLPGMIISGLMAIPYVDLQIAWQRLLHLDNRQRKFAISVFLFGFIVLWIALIILGTYIRGPGWQIFMPWEYWDPHRAIFEVNVDVSELVAAGRTSLTGESRAPTTGPYLARLFHPATVIGGIATVGLLGVIGGACVGYFKFAMPEMWKKMGFIRQQVVLSHLVIMILVVIKIALRLGLSIKYLW